MNNTTDTPNIDHNFYKTLLESTRAIPWKADWASMTFVYIGPQIETLLGWSQDSWVSIDDWAQRIHPEDRERVVHFCLGQSQSGVDHETDYRALTANGGYVWIRDVVHVARNAAGEVEALIGFMFDISERKKTEEALLTLQKELEALSFEDGLTGVGNRRHLDAILEREWMEARRNGRPLSLLMFDIDCFKQYNDHYGHLHGDDCLRRVALALSRTATRPRDFFARFGGEEFMLVLPETNAAAAARIAERCHRQVFKEQIPHASSAVSRVVTVSIGVGTAEPCASDELHAFITQVDQRLYQAKDAGRNRSVGRDS